MSIGPGYQGGRTRVGTKVFLNIYDLAPANEYLYPLGCGFHHSGVEIMGSEYSFASGAGIFDASPKYAPGAKFREQIEMGSFDGGQAALKQALQELRDEFLPDEYHLIRKNCNHFADALCYKLLRKRIPSHVNRLADIGVCCSCLLPRQMLQHAPVGDHTSTQSSGGLVAKSPATKAFVGQGQRLGTLTPPNGKKEDELTDRREKARKAALARMERNNQPQQGE